MSDMEKVINDLEYLISEDCTDTQYDYVESIQIAIDMLKEQPEIVRCKDCKYAYQHWKDFYRCDNYSELTTGYGNHTGDWYCANGERKEGR